MKQVKKNKESIPWRKEFNKDKFLGVDYRLEVGRGQVDNIRGRLGDGESGEGKRDERGEERRKAHPVGGTRKRLSLINARARAYLFLPRPLSAKHEHEHERDMTWHNTGLIN